MSPPNQPSSLRARARARLPSTACSTVVLPTPASYVSFWPLSRSARPSLIFNASGLSVFRPSSRFRSSAMSGGAMKTYIACSPIFLRVAAPWVSISTSTAFRLASSCSILSFGVPYRFRSISAHSRNFPAAMSASNSARVRKRYSTPFFSVPRGARVVVVITRGIPSAISFFATVDFPTPEGPEMTSRVPLLNVLHLLFDLLQLGFHVDGRRGDLAVVGLRRDRVRLAAHLLGQEVETPPELPFLGDDLAELADMRPQALDLFARVATVGMDRHFPDDVQLRGFQPALGEQLLDPVVQPLLVRLHHRRHARLDLAEARFDRVEMVLEC